ncbi:MAG TPA: hypothetical protein VHT29_02495 [Solirubrobacteraceae bacterium]|nr:hypothetical protein [Solirubrobacteraceae bacterium]
MSHFFGAALFALLLVPAGASAATPVLEFVVPGHSLPVRFTTAGGEVTAEGFSGAVMTCSQSSGQGEITGPRRAIAKYEFTECKTASPGSQKCKSEGAGAEEIKTGLIEAELVYIDQKNHEVAVLLNPRGGTYMSFECGGVPARGEGPFLAPGAPLNTETTSFTTTLSKLGGVQAPDEYEGAGGEKLKAVPLGEKNNNFTLEPTGVESTITVTTAEPVEVRAITAEEVEARQHEEAKKREEALQALETALEKQEEVFKKAEEHAKQLAGEAKKHEEEVTAQLAATTKQLEATEKQLAVIEAKTQPPTRAQLLAKALKVCQKQPKRQRARCIASARKRYGAKK